MSYEDQTSREVQVADQLRAVNFDIARLSTEARARVLHMARNAGIELWRPGLIWGSHREIGNYYRPAEATVTATLAPR